MAVGRGSMERAAKAVVEKKPADQKKAVVEKKTTDQKKTATEKKPVDQLVVKVQDDIITDQKSAGMLERAAEPNERFGVGDAMPFYYF